jgi:hypothetical protein
MLPNKETNGFVQFYTPKGQGASHLSFLKPLLDAQVCCNCSLVENPVFLDIQVIYVSVLSFCGQLLLGSIASHVSFTVFISFHFTFSSHTLQPRISHSYQLGFSLYSLCTCKVISFNLLHRGFQFLRWLLLLLSKLLDFFCKSKLLSRSGASCVLVIFGLFVV